jgi:hypothetical protein
MIYFDSDMSKSTNTVVYFDWKTVIYVYVCGKCRTQFMLPIEKSVTFTGTCANEIIPSINRSFVYKAKEESHYKIKNMLVYRKIFLKCNIGPNLLLTWYIFYNFYTIKKAGLSTYAYIYIHGKNQTIFHV